MIAVVAVITGGGELSVDRPPSGVTDGAVVFEGGLPPDDVAAGPAPGRSAWHPAGRVVARDGRHTLLARSGDDRAAPADAVATGQFVLLDADGREVWRAAGTARSTCVRRAAFTATAVEVTLCNGGSVAFHRTEGFVLARERL